MKYRFSPLLLSLSLSFFASYTLSTTFFAFWVTQEDRKHLKPFLDPTWDTPAAGITTTPFRFVKCRLTAQNHPAIKASITVHGQESKLGKQRTLHGALLCVLKQLIPAAGEGFVPSSAGFEGGLEEGLRTAAVAYLEARVARMASSSGGMASSGGGGESNRVARRHGGGGRGRGAARQQLAWRELERHSRPVRAVPWVQLELGLRSTSGESRTA